MTKNLMTKAPTRDELVQKLYEVDDNYSNYLDTLPAEKVARIKKSVSNMRHGLQTVAPIMCGGAEKCLFIEHCPIAPRTETGAPVMRNGVQDYGPSSYYPIGRPCVMETFYMQQKIIDYVEHLEVDPANPVEMAIVNELALIDLMKNRALIILSKGDRQGDGQDFMRVDITGHDPETGVSSQATSLHPAADMLERLEKRRASWLDKLLETRKAKLDAAAKMGKRDESDRVMDELLKLRNVLESNITKRTEDAQEIVRIELDD